MGRNGDGLFCCLILTDHRLGQADREGGAVGSGRLKFQFAPMTPDQFRRDDEAKARAALAGGALERGEEVILRAGRQAGARVTDLDPPASVIFARCDGDGSGVASCRDGLARVPRQV